MEEFLRIKREDVFSGQDLIPVYTAYLGRARYETYHSGEQTGDYACLSSDQVLAALQTNGRLPDIPAATLLSFLLGHNREDTANLPALLALLSYADGFGCRFACEGAQEEHDAVVIRIGFVDIFGYDHPFLRLNIRAVEIKDALCRNVISVRKAGKTGKEICNIKRRRKSVRRLSRYDCSAGR